MSDLLFTATGASGNELYRLNGNTLTLVDVRPGSASSTPSHLVLHYPRTGTPYCFFQAYTPTGVGRHLVRYNLMSGALTTITLPGQDPDPCPMPTMLGNTLLFVGDWNGTRRLYSMSPGAASATVLATPAAQFEAAPFVAFTSPNAALVRTYSGDLYRTDGTVAGTVQDSTLLDPVLVRLPGGTRVLSRGLLVVDNNSATPHVDLYP